MNPSEGVRKIAEEAEELGAHIFRWGASSNNLPTIKFREEKEKAINQILKALTQAEKRGFERARDEAAKVSEDFGDIALLISQTQKHLGSQGTQKGIAIAGERIAKEIRNLTYEKNEGKYE